MRLEHLWNHTHGTRISRRRALRLAGEAGLAGIAASVGTRAATGVHALAGEPPVAPAAAASASDPQGDEMFDAAVVQAGAWVPLTEALYGAGDQRGSFNLVTPQKTAQALRLLDSGRPVKTYNLGEMLFNGFPAYPSVPPRVYEQRLTVLGYLPKPGFAGFLIAPVPLGPNMVSAHEERFPVDGTYQLATQLDNLNHIGVGEMFYNGFKGPDIGETWGTNKLGGENMGPIVTRGIVLDIVGLKESQGTNDIFRVNGDPVLRDDYRITIDDIAAALARQRTRPPTPGDVVIFRTGWTHLVKADPDRYLADEPGIYLAEARHLAAQLPAIICSDTWALEVTDEAVTQGNSFPVHQLLFMRYGIRIGEAFVTEDLVGDGIFEFVFAVTPQFALGSTAGNTPPMAMAQPQAGHQ